MRLVQSTFGGWFSPFDQTQWDRESHQYFLPGLFGRHGNTQKNTDDTTKLTQQQR